MNLLQRIKSVWHEEGAQGISQRLRHRLQVYFPRWENKKWIARYSPNSEQLRKMAETELPYQPLISIILPVFNPPKQFLQEALESVLNQIYKNWELCIADDASSNPEIREILEKYSKLDQRIKVVFRQQNGHISAASNSALEIASGDFIALLDHDDLLASHALYKMAQAINDNPDADVFYSNEDKIDNSGRRSQPTFKPDWSPEYFMSFMYIGHLSMYRREVIEKAGGFRVGYEGSQDYDLALRVSEITEKIVHVPQILYHWRMHDDSVAVNIHAKPYAFVAAKKALQDSLRRQSLQKIDIKDTRALGIYKVETSGQDLSEEIVLTQSLSTVATNGNFSSCSFMELDTNSEKFAVTKVIENQRPYDYFSQAIAADKPYLIYLSPGLEIPIIENFNSLAGQLLRPGVSAVVPRVVHNKRILVGGTSLTGSVLTHNFYGDRTESYGYGARLVSVYNISMLSPMAFIIKTESLKRCLSELKNFDSFVPGLVALSFCLLRDRQRLVWTPHVTIDSPNDPGQRQYELKTFKKDYELLGDSFGLGFFKDPYYPLGLDINKRDFRIAI